MQSKARHKSQIAIIYTTVKKKKDAERISKMIVKEKLSACINIIPRITSVYNWKGKTVSEREYLLIIKTRKSLVDVLEKRIHYLHPYELPEFITINTEKGSMKYIKWLYENTIQKERKL